MVLRTTLLLTATNNVGIFSNTDLEMDREKS